MGLEILFECPLPNGIHARPASLLEEICQPFDAEIHLENLRNKQCVSMHSVLALIGADILYADNCRITIAGIEAEQAHKKLLHFIQHDFASCDEALPQQDDVTQLELPRSLALTDPDFIAAVSVSQGIATGKPVLLSASSFSAAVLQIKGQDVTIESQCIHDGLTKLQQALTDEFNAQKANSTQAKIIKAHLAIAKDEELLQRLLANLSTDDKQQTKSAAGAIVDTLEYFNQLLGGAKNVYLQERALDIQDICSRLMCLIYGNHAVSSIDQLEGPSIVITSTLTPSAFIALSGPHLKGLVLECGGRTSHTVLLARAAGIPVLVGATGALNFCHLVDSVIIDSNSGILLRNVTEATDRYYQLERLKTEQLSAKYQPFKYQKALTCDGQRLEVAANIASAQEATYAFEDGAEGIGLFRTEMLFMDRDSAPSEEEQFLAYQGSLQAANGQPVIIRTFDVGGDKPISYFNIADEENPFLGYRAVRTYPEFMVYFTTQLRALVRAAVHGNLRIMIPMISDVEEMRWVRETFDQVIAELQEAQVEYAVPQLGMMLEVPSAAFMIDQLAHYSDFFSIGSNDLTQYFLACDRGNKNMANLYSNYHPAFIRLLKKITDDAALADRWVGLCGEMAADTQLLPLLVGLGLDEVSMASPNIAQIKANIARLNFVDCQQLVTRVMACADIAAVEAQLLAFSQQENQRPLLDQELILTGRKVTSRAEAIKTLSDNLFVQGRVQSSTATEQALWKREDMFSTGLGFGIAIPHCKTDGITHNSISLLRLSQPIEWSEESEPVDLVFMLAVKQSDTDNLHMKYFSKLARKIVHKSFRDELRNCSDSSALLAYLSTVLEL
tara:strand:- start:11875 stop:14400 length:2526 start_codon:yes stop_codon:yes gene_type:complete